MIRKILFVLMLVFGLLTRFYKINAPLADWHSWRQADTSSVARNFVKSGYNLFLPKFDDLSSIPSGKENPNGYRLVEFPIYNFFHALLFQSFQSLKIFSFEATGRLVTIIASLLSAVFLYLIVKRVIDEKTAFLATFFFLFLPYNIFYSRVILPEPTMVAFALGSVFFALESKFLISSLFAAISILVKPYAIFIIIPSLAVIFTEKFFKEKEKPIVIIKAILYGLLIALPTFLWRLRIKQFPEGIPANNWLFNANGIRFRPAWWRWLFGERLANLILGKWGTVLFSLGLVGKTKKDILFYSWLAGIFMFWAIFATGNVQHDYYQIIAIPVISFFLAKGANFLLTPNKNFYSGFRFSLLAFSLLMLFGLSWYQVKEYYKINHPEIVEAGAAADKILPENAKVVAPYNGDTAFLYQTNRQGWPIGDTIEKMTERGANYFISVNFDNLTNEVISRCQLVEKGEKWLIASLENCHE